MRPIDADALLEKLRRTPRYFTVKFDIEEAPTIDAVPAVRCKDCKYYEPDEVECGCLFAGGLQYVKPDDFCSYGERKTNGCC